MPVTVRIPLQLRPQVGNNADIKTPAGTVKQVLTVITTQYPEFGKRLYKADSGEQVNKFINLYLNEEDVKFLDGLDTPTKDGDELMVELAVAGG
jgi:molybdopterin converting factor small subunit